MDTQQIRQQAGIVDSYREELKIAQELLAKVSARHGQECATLHINGVPFPITSLNRAWMPEVIRGMETIQRECIGILTARLRTIQSRLDGAEWKLKQLTR